MDQNSIKFHHQIIYVSLSARLSTESKIVLRGIKGTTFLNIKVMEQKNSLKINIKLCPYIDQNFS